MSQSGTFTLQSNAYQGRYLKLTCTTEQDIVNNRTKVNWTLESIGGSSGHYATKVIVNINGTEVYSIDKGYSYDAFPVTKGSTSGNIYVGMNSDGTHSPITIYMDAAIYVSSTTRYSDTYVLPTIPRYTSITSFTVSKRNETSFTFNWRTADTIDYLWYSTNNGSSWTGYDATDGTSGSFTVGGLSPNTHYNCKIRVRRRDSQLTTDSSQVSQTTYAIPNQWQVGATETTITIGWSLDSIASHIWYTIDGSGWVDVGDVNATSGTYTISGLGANTGHNITTIVRRKWVETDYASPTYWYSTYAYPYLTASQNFVIGNSVTVNFYNPLNRTIQIQMWSHVGRTFVTDLITCNGTSYTFTPTASRLYESIPNATESKYNIDVWYNDNKAIGDLGSKYSVNTSASTPTFTNFEYKDTADNLLTQAIDNNQVIVQNVSNVNVVISSANKMVAKNSATASKYQALFSNLSKTFNYSASDIDTYLGIPTGSGNSTFKVTAYDSRNISKEVSKTINIIPYSAPLVNVILARLNNFETETHLKLSGTFARVTISDVDKNAIQEVKYRYKESSASTWGAWTTMTISRQGSGSYETAEVTLPLDNTKQFTFEFQVTDKAKTTSASQVLSIGEPLMFLHTNGILEIQNGIKSGKADGTGSFQIHGGSNSNIYWKEYGYGDQFRIIPAFGGVDDSNKLIIQGAVGDAGTTPSLYDLMTISGKSGHVWVKSSVRIPKSGTAGMGITNSDGASIIRDWNNQNVTVDATGAVLYLGYQNTTGINILNGKDSISSDGTFTFTRGIGINFGSGTMKGSASYGDLIINNTGGYTYLAVNGTNILSVRSNGLYGKSGYPYYCGRDLYNNASGTNGTITLAETAANFTFIEIFYRIGNGSGTSSVKVDTGKNMDNISLTVGRRISGTTVQINTTTVKISGTSLTHVTNGGVNVQATPEIYTGNEIYITRVVGWRTT